MIAKKISNPRKGAPKATRIRLLTEYVGNPETASATEKCICYGARGFLAGTPAAHTAEMIALAEEAVRSPDPITHFVFSWGLGEHPTEEQVEGCIDILADEMELSGHQIIYGLHADTKNSHLHVVVNRVKPEDENGKFTVLKINRGFDIEAAHRVGTRIEADQGWAVEPNKRYRVCDDGSLERTAASEARQQSPGQRELDAERRTGTKSVARIAIQQAAPAMAAATTWAELHACLAQLGMRYERKGSGAVVVVNSIPVKASRVARQAALKQLEKRLGAFRGLLAVQQEIDEAPVQHAESGNPDPADAVPLITAATNWPELHASLAGLCMRYEKVGGGATIIVDGKRHRASAVAREASLKQLEKRLGPFKDAPAAQQGVGVASPTGVEPLIAAASSWAEFHAGLAELGMRYERVGSGAAITVDGTRHKASSVARQASLKQLERRFGLFQVAPAAQQGVGVASPAGVEPLIAAASSWAEFHAGLAELRMRYERVGSGATITVDGTRHKASSVARQASLGSLQKRLGPFQPAAAMPDDDLLRQKPQPLDGNEATWQDYRQAREAHNVAKDPARLALEQKWDREFRELRRRQKADREELLQHSWKGSGLALNALRSVLAREHVAQTAELRQERRTAQRQLRLDHPPLPSYDEWLSDVQRWWQEQTRLRLLLPAKAETGESGPLRPVPGYSPEQIGSRVHYGKPPGASAAFVDFGRSIAMCGSGIDDDALLAAMTLAVQKWGEFVASGDPAFLAASVHLAALHDLPLANPELQDELERERARHQEPTPRSVPDPVHPMPEAKPPKARRSSFKR